LSYNKALRRGNVDFGINFGEQRYDVVMTLAVSKKELKNKRLAQMRMGIIKVIPLQI